jgi:SAM-dependent methyltransferase
VQNRASNRAWAGATADPLAEAETITRQRLVDAHFEADAAYWRTVYESDGVEAEMYRARRARALAIPSELGCPRGTRILEVGCGAGSAAVALARRGYVVYAVDTAPAMIALTRRTAREAGVAERVIVLRSDAARLPFADGAFGLVLALGLVPWLPALHVALRELGRVLGASGHVVVSADNRWRLNHVLDPRFFPLLAPLRGRVRGLLERLRARGADGDQARPRVHSIRELDREIATSGLAKVHGATLGFGPFSLMGCRPFSERTGVRIHRRLQRLADRGWPLVRSLGSQYVAIARKPAADGATREVRA